MITEKLEGLIKEALESLSIKPIKIHLEHPEFFKQGDYSTSVALTLAPSLTEKPLLLAQKIKNYIDQKKLDFIKKVEVAGPGFLNFFLADQFFRDSILDILKQKEKFGQNKTGLGQTVIVEYSSPNIAKPFTVGHLRSTIIGQAISNLLAFSGFNVIRDNHIGDWGTQFGKLMVAIKKWGDVAALDQSKSPVKLLVDWYIKFHEEAKKDPSLEDEARSWFVRLEQKDEEAYRLWRKCVDLSMVEFGRIYEKLGIRFDLVVPESFFEDKMGDVLKDLQDKNMLEESEGAHLVFFPTESNLPPLMIIKSDGATLYATRELATDKYRKEKYQPDLIINEVGAEQSLYFKQIFEVEERLGYFPKNKRIHVAHGLYRFKEGKMSTRQGNVIWLEDLINEAVLRAGAINQETALPVAIGALKFNDLKRESLKDIVFDWDEILNLKGDSGPYLQYTAVRAGAVLLKAQELNIPINLDQVEEISEIERFLYRFPEVVQRASLAYAPHYLATYLLDLARSFNTYYGGKKIVDQTNPISSYRLALTEALFIVIKNGLELLGLKIPEKM